MVVTEMVWPTDEAREIAPVLEFADAAMPVWAVFRLIAEAILLPWVATENEPVTAPISTPLITR